MVYSEHLVGDGQEIPRELPGIPAPTAFYNGRNVAVSVPTRLFLSPFRPA